MAYEVITTEVYLNGYRYKARSPIVGSFIDPFPGQLSIGGDDYQNQLGTSSYVIDDLTGGIGDEVFRSPNRCYWTNCIIEYPGHILPPRLATALTATAAAAGWLSAVSWTDPNSGWGGEPNMIDNNTATGGSSVSVASAGTSEFVYFQLGSVNVDSIRFDVDQQGTDFTVDVDAYYDDAWNSVFNSSTYNAHLTWNTVALGATKAVTEIRLRFTNGAGGNESLTVYEIQANVVTAVITPIHFANYDGDFLMSVGNTLYKMNAGRTAFTVVQAFHSLITAIIPSLNSRLYIYQGDSENYWWMSTADALTQSNSAVAYWGIQYDAKLFKMATTGAVAYSTDPDGATPTWTSGGAITDIVDQIEGFMVGNDATGADALYIQTNSILKVYDSATPQWLDTKVSLPNHPNGGKGATYFNGAHYLSYGLAVKQYIPTAAVNIQDVGLTERDGLPIEYNGEIVKLQGDAGTKLMFALVDASQTSGNSKSGLYAFDGSAWFCWWIDTSNNGAMNDCIVSSASSGYAVYWDVGGVVYYIDIPRGVQNPNKISQSYGTAGVLLSPWFDSGDKGAAKLAKYLNDFAKGVTTSETVALSYRIDHATTTVDTVSSIGASWTTLDTLNTTGEDGYNEELFASGAGIAFKSIQFRLDFVTAGSTSKADIQNLKLLYRMRTGALKIRRWIVDVLLDDYANGPTGNETAKAKIANLKSMITSPTDVVFSHRPNAASDESYYVSVECEKFEENAGPEYKGGYYRLVLTEV